MVQLSTLQMTVFTQQQPNIWATSQLISSEQFKWGNWLLKSNLSAFWFPNSSFSFYSIYPIHPSKQCSLQNSHSCLVTQCINAPSTLNIRISSICYSTTYAQKVSSPALIKIPSNSLSFLSLGLQVTEKQQCFIWPSWRQSWHVPPAGYLVIQSTSISCQASNLAVPVHLTSSKLHISWLPAQEMCVFAMGSRYIKKYIKSLKPQTIANTYHLSQKKPWGKK